MKTVNMSIPAISTKYISTCHLAATPGAAYPPCLGLAYLGQYLGHILSKVYGCDFENIYQLLAQWQ